MFVTRKNKLITTVKKTIYLPRKTKDNLFRISKNTRGASNLNCITPNANLCSTNSFSHNAIRDWNSLPISIKNVTNKEAFKNAVKDFFKFEARRREENEYFYF